MENLDGYWIPETMKVYGAIHTMSCQYVKVGTGMDLKIYVPAVGRIASIKDLGEIIKKFKRELRSSNPVKLDILNLLRFSETFLKETQAYQEQIAETNKPLRRFFSGFYSVYQKDLGQNRAVVNISFLETPSFITLAHAPQWSLILPELHTLVLRIEEQGDAVNGLKKLRDFLSSGQLQDFGDFSFWYGRYLMQELAKEHFYILPLRTNILDLIFQSMANVPLTEIINNEGFRAIAAAIKRSTISLQFTPKKQRNFEIQYGIPQTLQIKSKSKTDLATFIGAFAASYNAETARKKESFLKRGEVDSPLRTTIKVEELNQFYTLLDNHDSKLVGAMLASYGFALNEKDKTKDAKDEANESDEDL